MAIDTDTLFSWAALKAEGSVRWRVPLPETRPGVYVIASHIPAGPDIPLDREKIGNWMQIASGMTLDGQAAPSIDALRTRLARYWQPGETILYVGLAGKSLRKRIDQFYKHKVGHNKPHSGGFWLKLLNDEWLSSVSVYWATTGQPDLCEYQMLRGFAERRVGLSGDGPHILPELVPHIPFANVQIELPENLPGARRKALKPHGLKGHTVDPRSIRSA